VILPELANDEKTNGIDGSHLNDKAIYFMPSYQPNADQWINDCQQKPSGDAKSG